MCGGHPRENSYNPETDRVILYHGKRQESRIRRFSKELLIVCPPYFSPRWVWRWLSLFRPYSRPSLRIFDVHDADDRVCVYVSCRLDSPSSFAPWRCPESCRKRLIRRWEWRLEGRKLECSTHSPQRRRHWCSSRSLDHSGLPNSRLGRGGRGEWWWDGYPLFTAPKKRGWAISSEEVSLTDITTA